MDDSDWGLLDPLRGTAPEVSDDSILAAMLAVERELAGAWAAILGRAAPADAVFDPAALDRAALRGGLRADGVMVPALVAQLRSRAAPGDGAGDLVHRGATSQDILDSALMLTARDALVGVRGDLETAGRSLAALADAERATVTVAVTLGQAAAPTTLGIAAAVWLEGVTSAIEQLDAVRYPVQLGGAVGTGEAFSLGGSGDAGTPERLRADLAERLHLADPGRSWHTERTPVLAVASAAAAVCAVLGRLGRDLTLLGRSGVDQVRLASVGGSSAMPHKRNPVDAVLLVAQALEAPGLLATVYSAAVSADARPSGEWHAEWQALRGVLRLARGSAAAAVSALDGLDVDHAAVEFARQRDTAWIGSSDPAVTSATTMERSDRIVAAAVGRFAALAADLTKETS